MAALIAAVLMFGACTSEKYEVEKNFKTLAGSVESHPYYFVSASLDNSGDLPLILSVGQVNKSTVTFDISSLDYKSPIAENSQIVSVGTSSVELEGKVGDVNFDKDVEVTVHYADNKYSKSNGRVKGHLQSTYFTKTSPAQFDLWGNVEIQFKDNTGADHVLTVKNIKASASI